MGLNLNHSNSDPLFGTKRHDFPVFLHFGFLLPHPYLDAAQPHCLLHRHSTPPPTGPPLDPTTGGSEVQVLRCSTNGMVHMVQCSTDRCSTEGAVTVRCSTDARSMRQEAKAMGGGRSTTGCEGGDRGEGGEERQEAVMGGGRRRCSSGCDQRDGFESFLGFFN
ncbi:hypothetical protein E3N88_18311 [Mikania micrantha]|uniref:Uncharacterized protein n=1 Tax=Mikania micrantha TaxID=192012 RepID=A0A5N6NWL1_9ASTR|nr:hypothetical protein E3N88_18311 [Mikania micrantha]